MTGFVYAMLDRRSGYVKIGFSSNPTYREHTLQAEQPDIELIALCEGTLADERALHQSFADRRLRGEWFWLESDDLLGLVSSIESDQLERHRDFHRPNDTTEFWQKFFSCTHKACQFWAALEAR